MELRRNKKAGQPASAQASERAGRREVSRGLAGWSGVGKSVGSRNLAKSKATGWKWNFGEIKKLSSSSVARTPEARAFDTREQRAPERGRGRGVRASLSEVETVAARTAI